MAKFLPLHRKTKISKRVAVAVAAPLALLGVMTVFATSAALPPGEQTAANRTLIWNDEFNGPANAVADPAKWAYEEYAGGNGELQYYRSGANNAVQNGAGQMVITARQENFGGRNYTSARLNAQYAPSPFRFTYGRMEARIKVPHAPGMFPAFWFMGDYDKFGWPGNGEIDVMETINNAPDLYGTLHVPDPTGADYGPGGRIAAANTTWGDDYHVYAAEWTPTYVEWFVDDVSYYKVTKASVLAAGGNWVFDQRPQAAILNLAVGGDWPGPPDISTRFPQQMLIDWVRIYAPVSAGPTATMTPTPTPSPAPTNAPIRGDINSSGKVDVFDLSLLLNAWGTSSQAADLNHDGVVNIFDLSILLSSWS